MQIPTLNKHINISNQMKTSLSWKQMDLKGQVDFTEFAEFAENHNFLSSLIIQSKNYP